MSVNYNDVIFQTGCNNTTQHATESMMGNSDTMVTIICCSMFADNNIFSGMQNLSFLKVLQYSLGLKNYI